MNEWHRVRVDKPSAVSCFIVTNHQSTAQHQHNFCAYTNSRRPKMKSKRENMNLMRPCRLSVPTFSINNTQIRGKKCPWKVLLIPFTSCESLDGANRWRLFLKWALGQRSQYLWIQMTNNNNTFFNSYFIPFSFSVSPLFFEFVPRGGYPISIEEHFFLLPFLFSIFVLFEQKLWLGDIFRVPPLRPALMLYCSVLLYLCFTVLAKQMDATRFYSIFPAFAVLLKVQPQWFPSAFGSWNRRLDTEIHQGEGNESSTNLWDMLRPTRTHIPHFTLMRRSFSIKTNVNFSGMWKDFISLGPKTHLSSSGISVRFDFETSCSVVL